MALACVRAVSSAAAWSTRRKRHTAEIHLQFLSISQGRAGGATCVNLRLSTIRLLLWLLLLPVHLLHVQHLEDGLTLPVIKGAGPLRLHDAHRKQ